MIDYHNYLHKMTAMNYYYRRFSWEYFLQSVQSNGFKQIELWTCTHHFDINHCGYQKVNPFKQQLRDHNLSIVCITPEQSNPKPYNLAANTSDLKKKTSDYLQHVIHAANELEIPMLALNSGWNYYDEDVCEAWQRSCQMMYQIAEYAQSYGVQIVMEALQPDESQLVNSIHDLAMYLKQTNHPNLFINIDLGAMAKANETIEQYYLTFGNRIRHCHFVDGAPTGHLAWGQGQRDLLSDLAVFNENDYTGYFSFEFANSSYFNEPKKIEKRALDYIQMQMNQSMKGE